MKGNPKYLQIGVLVFAPALVVLSAFSIVQQLIFLEDPFFHHALICASVFVLAAYYAETFGKNLLIKACIVFSILGMALGGYELLALLLFPEYFPESLCAQLWEAL